MVLVYCITNHPKIPLKILKIVTNFYVRGHFVIQYTTYKPRKNQNPRSNFSLKSQKCILYHKIKKIPFNFLVKHHFQSNGYTFFKF